MLDLFKIVLLISAVMRGYFLLAFVFFVLPFVSRLAMGLLFIDGVQSQTTSFMFIGTIMKLANIISIGGLVYTAFAPPNRR
jgi:hypothetical protein